MGLAHSARQGEAYGAFRWARGHYLAEPRDPRDSYSQWADSSGVYLHSGTIMSYGSRRWGVFSDPDADCGPGCRAASLATSPTAPTRWPPWT